MKGNCSPSQETPLSTQCPCGCLKSHVLRADRWKDRAAVWLDPCSKSWTRGEHGLEQRGGNHNVPMVRMAHRLHPCAACWGGRGSGPGWLVPGVMALSEGDRSSPPTMAGVVGIRLKEAKCSSSQVMEAWGRICLPG